MKVTRFLVSLLFLGVASNAFAAGSVSINWDTCVGPQDKAVAPGSIVSLNMSVLGQSDPHQAYQVQLTLGSPGGLKDAWRFDPAGCQGSSFITINHLAPAAISKACPTFQGSFASVQVKDYSYDALTGKARLSLYNAYPPNNSVQINPAVRYFLGGVTFDHTFSVVGPGTPAETCGGVEAPVCVHITSATWLTPAGVEIPWAISQEFVTANDPQNLSHCPGATPATTTTWGSLKNQYR
jgi:hypothetical protein